MTILGFLLLSILPFFTKEKPTTQTDMIKVITYNIRYDNPKDGKNNWKYRKTHVADFLQTESPDFFGVQEALFHQAIELGNLMPDYHWVGVGRADGNKDGEFTSIFFKKDKYFVEKTGTFWLSETPEIIGSKGWDAALPRIATWAIFKNKQTDSTYFVLNTHFDHIGDTARVESAKLILKQVKALNQKAKSVIMGDLNVTPRDKVYTAFTQNTDFRDARKATETAPKGKKGTFNNFKIKHFREATIDYIFVDKRLTVKSYEVPTPQYDNRQASDHYPIVITLVDD